MLNEIITVTLGKRSYPIYLGEALLDKLGPYCRKHGVPRRVVVVADRNSARVALRRVQRSLANEGFQASSIVIPPGERQKSTPRASAIFSEMLALSIPREATVIALGGGVVGDVAGFVASTYKRGVAFVQCPTTLLSQVDSSVGGKNGVNYPLAKNAMGTFLQPAFVLSDIRVLKTLTRREVIAGLGEILKYPLVADPALLTFLEDHLDSLLRLDPGTVTEVARRCLRIKSRLVSLDERERLPDKGRVLLNVGHAIGHPLESLSHYVLRHGEAVFLGILAEGHIAERREGFRREDLNRFVDIYRRTRATLGIQNLQNRAIVKSVMSKAGTRFVLPQRPGRVVVVRDVTARQVEQGLQFLREVLRRSR